jgi:hypothetical protein
LLPAGCGPGEERHEAYLDAVHFPPLHRAEDDVAQRIGQLFAVDCSHHSPVLTLWATVVAERLGYPAEMALTLSRFVAGSSARAKAHRLGIGDEKRDAEEGHAQAAELKPRRQTIRLLGRDIPVLPADDGRLRAGDDGKPASAKSVQSYIAGTFGDRAAGSAGCVTAARGTEPRRVPSLRAVSAGRAGRRAGVGGKGELRVERIVSAAG